jgi:putative addiction module component (TIGR02574 family)
VRGTLLPGPRARTTTWSRDAVPATLGAMAPKNLLDAALALPPEERLELASQLLASVENAPGEEWNQAWLAECDARMAAAESGAEPAAPWNEALDRLRARLAHP